MDRNRLKGNWKQLRGAAQEKWGELTDDDLDVVEGKWDQLVGKIQERYGMARDKAERQVRDWDAGLEDEAREAGGREAL